jgi:hypothetical protein
MNPKVDFYFSKAKKWKEELEKLRMIVLDCHFVDSSFYRSAHLSKLSFASLKNNDPSQSRRI